MGKSLISVVVPTRERPETLAKCLATCIAQDFDDYEIVVCDNAGSSRTRAVVEAANSPKIVYVRTGEPLAMSANWELAVSRAQGDYITVIGDDDGLMPHALRELAQLISEWNRPAAIQWTCAHYNWPTIAVPEEANYLAIPMSRSAVERSGRAELLRAARFEIGYEKLPMINTALIRRDIIDAHRTRCGFVFGGLYPDVYTAYAFAYLCDTYLSVSVPMHVAGLSGRSNGVAALMERGASAISTEFYSLQRSSGYVRHATVPDYELFPVHADDSFQQAKSLLFPNDDALSLDRRAMLDRYLAAIPDVGDAERAGIMGLIRSSLADRPDLKAWLDETKPQPSPCAPFRLKPKHMGFDGQFLHLDTSALGVEHIGDAVGLAARILQIGAGPIRFDLEMLPETIAGLQAALIERSRALEGALADLATVQADLAERSHALEVTLADLAEVRATLVERTQTLESTLATLIERTARLEDALATSAGEVAG